MTDGKEKLVIENCDKEPLFGCIDFRRGAQREAFYYSVKGSCLVAIGIFVKHYCPLSPIKFLEHFQGHLHVGRVTDLYVRIYNANVWCIAKCRLFSIKNNSLNLQVNT